MKFNNMNFGKMHFGGGKMQWSCVLNLDYSVLHKVAVFHKAKACV